MGAYGFTHKPVERDLVVSTLQGVKSFVEKTSRRVGLVGEDGATAELLRQCFEGVDVYPDLTAGLSPENRPDGLVVEAQAMPAADLVEGLKAREDAPIVVVYAPEALPADEDRRLRLGVFGGLLRVARGPDQLIEQTSLLLHQADGELSEAARAQLAAVRHDDAVLKGRKVVVIDDDIRNIFSLASALEDYGVELFHAESGRAGLDLLDAEGEVDVVLVDIMMPDMDGYETIREIRSRGRLAELPIVAVTAKAMKGDRQKCIQAGASDYVSKPVDIDQLVSVLRVSIQRAEAHRLASDSARFQLPQAR
jgi:CheY-like chemotaxis protein